MICTCCGRTMLPDEIAESKLIAEEELEDPSYGPQDPICPDCWTGAIHRARMEGAPLHRGTVRRAMAPKEA